MGNPHDAEYFRARRRAQGIPARGDYDRLPRIVAMGEELKRLMDLPWPPDLFRDSTKVTALQQRVPLNAEALCKCGCGKEHRGNVTMTVPSQYGHGFNVHYFYLEACKTRYVRLNGRK